MAAEEYPVGLFRTTCIIPASLLNNGVHTVDVYINRTGAYDSIIVKRSAISFDVQEAPGDRSEFLGEWIGAVRPRLLWRTTQLE